MSSTDLTFSEEELRRIAGGYKRPGDQIKELHRRGFYRARIGKVTGQVILERAHYDAVCAGAGAAANDANRPKLRSSY